VVVPELSPEPSHQPVLLGGRYHLGQEIGRGGMGVVHRAWDTELSRHVAVKILRDRAGDPAARARFRVEGETLARLSHPGLIAVFDAATDGEEPYLVMELVDGDSLAELTRSRWLELDDVAEIGADLAEALEYVHAHRIVHRDLKPGNVLIGADGRAKLADFGVARLLDGFTRHTATGMTIGTARYLSPEQVRGEALTGASDVYALGLVLIEALSGEPAFVGSWDVIALARLTTSPRIDERWPQPLRELLTAMTARDPLQRPTAAAVAAELRGLPAGTEPIAAPVPFAPAAVPAGVPVTGPEVDSTQVPEVDSTRAADLGPTRAADIDSIQVSRSHSRELLVAVAAALLLPALMLGARLHWAPDSPPADSGANGSVPVTPAATSGTATSAPRTSSTRIREVAVVVRRSQPTSGRPKKLKGPAADALPRAVGKVKDKQPPKKADPKGPGGVAHPPAGPHAP
jgi:eukaryotic-like serine/threonine-protein kinase